MFVYEAVLILTFHIFCDQYLTVEAADLAKEQQQSPSLDEYQLGELEEQLRKMNSLLETAQTQVTPTG